MICRLGKELPWLAGNSYVAESAQVIGRVRILGEASVWMGAVLRGDIEEIVLGRGSNVQENSSLHTSEGLPLRIGERVTIGHCAVLHSCTVGDDCLIGMGAILLDGAEIGEGSLVAAGALVVPGSKFPPHSLVLGAPARRQKELEPSARQDILENAERYVRLARRYCTELFALEASGSLGSGGTELREQQWKLVVYVPQSLSANFESPSPEGLAEEVSEGQREELLKSLKAALFEAGAGVIGCYRKCSWQSAGLGQFEPRAGSAPVIGQTDQLCRVPEFKLELLCPAPCLKSVLDALYRAHPYESPAYEIYPVYQHA